MPLNANFIADFSSFLDATKSSINATHEFERAAAGVGPAIDQSLGQAGTAIDENAQKWEKFGAGIGTALASQELRNLAGDVKQFATVYIAEYAQAEEATARLSTALKNSGAPPDVIESYTSMATALQDVSRFSDEAITDAATLLTTVGNIKPDAMEATLKATMDLAIGMGMELEPAARLVAKAASSGGEELGKLKTILGDSVPEGAAFADVMGAINEKFGGQALSDLETTAGSMAHLNNAMSDVNETVGKVLADNLTSLLSLFQSMPEGLQTFTLAVVGLGTALAPLLVSLGSLVSILATTGLGAGIVSAFTAILPFLGPAGLIAAGLVALWAVWKNWDAIVTFTKGIYEGIKLWLGDKLGAIFDWIGVQLGKVAGGFKALYNAVVGHSYVPDMINGIAREFGRLDSVMVAPTIDAMNLINDKWQEFSGQWGLSEPRNLRGDFRVEQAPGGLPTLVRNRPDTTTPWGGDRSTWSGAGQAPAVTINMSGMMGTDDPQTRSMLRDLVSEAIMQGMRGSRLMGTA